VPHEPIAASPGLAYRVDPDGVRATLADVRDRPVLPRASDRLLPHRAVCDPRIDAVTARGRRLPLLGALVVLALSGCTATVPQAGELVGTWHDDLGAPRLTLSNGGTCSARLLGTAQGVANGPCTWRIGVDGARDHLEHGHAVVQLDFSGAPDSAVGRTRFELDGSGATGSLIQDDPATDARVTLRR
jgi:hypothetical protein